MRVERLGSCTTCVLEQNWSLHLIEAIAIEVVENELDDLGSRNESLHG